MDPSVSSGAVVDSPPDGGAKRGARACLACRGKKARCHNLGGPNPGPCQRCVARGTPQSCTYDAPTKTSNPEEERLDRMERSLHQVEAVVGQLHQLLSRQLGAPFAPLGAPPPALHQQFAPTQPQPTPPIPMSSHSMSMAHSLPALTSASAAQSNGLLEPAILAPPPPNAVPSISLASPPPWAIGSALKRALQDFDGAEELEDGTEEPSHPPLPNYRAPSHPAHRYGFIRSAAASDDEGDGIPKAALSAPFEALAEAAAVASDELNPEETVVKPQRKKRRRGAPAPPNAFPDVVTKALVTDQLARHLFQFYMDHLQPHLPLYDSTYDTYDSLRVRSPWSINAALAVAAQRVPNPTAEIRQAAEYALEEAHGIARSSLFAATVRSEGVAAMLISSAWGESSYTPVGHAVRMGSELGLEKAVEKIRDTAFRGRVSDRTEKEEYELVSAARLSLALFHLDWSLATKSGRPHGVVEESVSEDKLEAFERHRLSIPSDRMLVANIRLIMCPERLQQFLIGPTIDARVSDFARRAQADLLKWWETSTATFAPDSFSYHALTVSLHSSIISLVTRLLEHHTLTDENLSVAARELAVVARDSAAAIIGLALNQETVFKASLQHAMQPEIVDVAFAALLYLKLSRLFPSSVSAQQVAEQGHELHTFLLHDCRQLRFALTIRAATERFAKAMGIDSPPPAVKNEAPTENDSQFSSVLAGDLAFNTLGNGPFLDLPPDWGTELPRWLETGGGIGDKDWEWGSQQGLDRLFLPL